MKNLLIWSLLATSAVSFGQTRSSFVSVGDITGITVTPSGGGLHYAIALGPNPEFTYNSVSYAITEVFGFWVMRDSNPDQLNPVNANFGVWDTKNSDAGDGEIAGWKTNPNSGLVVNQSENFVFSALNASAIDRYGFHVRINGTFPGTTGNTGYITGNLVPEPATISLFVVGAAAMIRRRRK